MAWSIDISGDVDTCIRQTTEIKNKCGDAHTRMIRNGQEDDDSKRIPIAAERTAIEAIENFLFTCKREYKGNPAYVFECHAHGDKSTAGLSFIIKNTTSTRS